MTFPSRLLNDGEHVVVSTRTHPKVLMWPLLSLLLVLAAAVLLTRVGSGGTADTMHLVVWGVAVLALLWLVVRPAVAWWTTSYTFTNRRFMKRSGFVAKQGRTIPLNRISGVDFDIGVVDRLFGCGTLVVSDASEEGRVEVHDIPRVEEVQKTVAAELDRLSGHHSADDGS